MHLNKAETIYFDKDQNYLDKEGNENDNFYS